MFTFNFDRNINSLDDFKQLHGLRIQSMSSALGYEISDCLAERYKWFDCNIVRESERERESRERENGSQMFVF
jgi:hypothetical protein